jgi:hypothetical protein
MQPQDAAKSISVAEVDSHVAYVQRVRAAANATERKDALADHLLAFGFRALFVWQELAKMAPDEQKSFYSDVLNEVEEMFVLWIKGKNLTRRPDEAERRARAGLSMLKELPDSKQLSHFAVQAILGLPEGHPCRDTDLARKCVLEELAWLRMQGESTNWVCLAGALGVAYQQRYGTPEEMLSWEPWAAEAAPHLEALGALRMWTGGGAAAAARRDPHSGIPAVGAEPDDGIVQSLRADQGSQSHCLSR